MINPPADYDNTWKQALIDYFQPFMSLCFPAIYPLVNWSRGYQVLEQELQEIVSEAKSPKRLADKLFQVWLVDGKETWLMILMEVQSQYESGFAQRMYQYNYRTFDKHEQPVISLAVLGDDNSNWRPAIYEYVLDGFQLSMRYPICKILDYESEWERLEQSSNPFAMMIMAHLKTKATTNKSEEREVWKWRLVRSLFEKGYERDDVILLFRLLDRMMTLPQELQQKFKQEVRSYQEERKVRLLSFIEEEAIAEGMQKGIQQGIQQQYLQTLLMARETIMEVLNIRFQSVPSALEQRLNNISDLSLLRQLHVDALRAGSLADFEGIIPE